MNNKFIALADLKLPSRKTFIYKAAFEFQDKSIGTWSRDADSLDDFIRDLLAMRTDIKRLLEIKIAYRNGNWVFPYEVILSDDHTKRKRYIMREKF